MRKAVVVEAGLEVPLAELPAQIWQPTAVRTFFEGAQEYCS
jgi:hypothetical protein